MQLPGPESPLKAVLWDMDGTIVDTEPYWIAAEHALVEAHGGTWSHEQAMQLVGQSLTFSAGLLQKAGVALSIRDIIDHLTAEVVSSVRQEVPWRPGARELLEDLHLAGVRCALVTMSEGPLARQVVDSLPRPYFEFLVTGDSVSRGKPHPEAYLTAVERLQETDPHLHLGHCVALEDSAPGVAAAVASGVTTVAIPHIVPLPEHSHYTLWDTLAGRSRTDLEELLAAADKANPAAGPATAVGTTP
ncbi:haloacid dehalogenase superfamily, subfamily IA, variant 3 with third motif having DD or ED [Pseudarthrobacter equi]|uniref:Haloacid dehalogenase superfamily, subfamily IA, variant 3 with third motif having DD or ED n=1 Tax=Pseudarthrobacter equi TaxID=728066 RepID=A0A1H1Z627_9MICC|nr:HAD family phosphatase [Pseudarthrobacter equi]SDT29275.1 haloacid dehalogenase superfamily, subfamily IA, variant 3 with third motif having DD or ED [Pseudarthrobacter equi]